MKSLWLLRVLFVFIFSFSAYSLTNNFFGFVFGFFIAIAVVIFEIFARNVSLKGLSSTVFGIILGLLLSKIFTEAIKQFNLPSEFIQILSSFMTIIFVYLGITLGVKGKSEFNLVIPYVKFKRQELTEESIIIDTSIIIDGRILDIVKTGFLEAKFIVPMFVLNELRTLADSTDHLKRQRGKRGIEILHLLKKEPNIDVVIYQEDIEGVNTVDEKIVKLAQNLDTKILTTDYNLNRIAQLQGVKVLNINDLVNALKPVFISGERFSVKLVKEGKEQNQAVGYLEDGTMVVVENAKWLIGKTVNVEVSSVLQSPSGRIVFTKIIS